MAAHQDTSARRLATPLQFVKGVGPQRAELFARLGLNVVSDLLFYFPRDHADLTELRPISRLDNGALVSVRGVVEEVDQRVADSGRSVTGVLIRDGRDHLRGVWFNQPFMVEKFRPGQTVLFSGKALLRGLFWEMHHPKVRWLADDEMVSGRILPIYSLCEGLKQEHIRRAMETALESFAGDLEETFPPEFLTAHNLWPIGQAVRQIHFPESTPALEHARRRFVYQELFILQLALAMRRARQAKAAAPLLPATAQIDARIRRLFPFAFTPDQEAAIADVTRDLAQNTPMNRLLQGDVGCGKTVVAAYAALLAVAQGQQVALMAPTEVLARQHAQTFSKLLAQSQVRLELLIGGLPPAERSDLLARVAAGDVDLVMGTQALIEEDVQFARLGLVIIDEQHKFGVRQRASLKQSGLQPHYLVMTATPIPRSVTMTLFGDLELTTIRDLPPGRQPVHTYLAREEQRGQWWEFVRKKLREGRQAYVVTPRVEGDETGASVEERFEALANGELEAFRLSLVHGRMPQGEKDAQMEAFRRGQTQVLVCTTVVEVGIDVPQATLMTIEGGERFGLAQLHQLRGRISRGAHPGFCTVFAEPRTEEAIRRLEAFVSTTDGFRLAELDFELRGPGHLLGTRQHGLPPFRIADMVRDAAVLQEARRDAQQLVAADPDLAQPQHARLKKMATRRYGSALDLADVG
jgi:ATP-dependent DNA helicase RecG